MSEENNIMSYESVLPPDFDGVFRFSNPSNEDFIGVWDSKEYLFPAGTTTPLVMTGHSPLEVQHIRKKFAKDLAEREFYKSKGYKAMAKQEGTPGNRTFSGIHQAPTYTLKELEPYIKECLKPLPASKLTSKPAQREKVEDKLHKKDDGSYATEAIDSKTSLRQKALNS